MSKAHNAIRPKYYDPARPPAASKAVVAGTGRAGVRYAMDMIAVPSSRGTPASGPEHGHGLTADEAAAGWISLFDGATTFGWKDAKVENGTLSGGETTARFGNCELRGEFAAAARSRSAGEDHAVTAQTSRWRFDETGAAGPIRLGQERRPQVARRPPAGLKPLFNGRDLAGWTTIERSGPTDKPSPFWRVEQRRAPRGRRTRSDRICRRRLRRLRAADRRPLAGRAFQRRRLPPLGRRAVHERLRGPAPQPLPRRRSGEAVSATRRAASTTGRTPAAWSAATSPRCG